MHEISANSHDRFVNGINKRWKVPPLSFPESPLSDLDLLFGKVWTSSRIVPPSRLGPLLFAL